MKMSFFKKATALMTSCVFVVFSSTIAFAKATDRIVYQKNTVVWHILNQQTERLLERGIDVNIIDNKIYLKNPTEANIEKANEILNSTVLTRVSYPTSWYPMNGFSYTTSKKF